MRAAADLCSSFFKVTLDLLYPPKCALCGLLSPEVPCIGCAGEMRPLEVPVIYETGGPLAFRSAVYEYTGRSGQAVRRLKYARSTSLSAFMSQEIAKAANELRFDFDIALPVPIHWSRLCQRGFNQAEILASRLPMDATLLRRIRATRPQVGLNREQRTKNLAGAFRAGSGASGKKVLLIDDVVTSGQTARECAKVLLEAGAVEVGILAFCGDA